MQTFRKVSFGIYCRVCMDWHPHRVDPSNEPYAFSKLKMLCIFKNHRRDDHFPKSVRKLQRQTVSSAPCFELWISNEKTLQHDGHTKRVPVVLHRKTAQCSNTSVTFTYMFRIALKLYKKVLKIAMSLYGSNISA